MSHPKPRTSFRKLNSPALILIFYALLVLEAYADSYSTFTTTEYFSPNRQFSLKLTPKKVATFYENGPARKKLWTAKLPQLPAVLLITDDGERIILIDHYYGNNHTSDSVVVFLDKYGQQLHKYGLSAVADLSRVIATTSSSHWLYGAFYDADQSRLIVETVIAKCKGPSRISSNAELALANECFRSVPYEEIIFSVETAEIIGRNNIQNKYNDDETRLLHELYLAETDGPDNKLHLASCILTVAKFYKDNKDFPKAKAFYERGLPLLESAIGSNGDANELGEAATVYRELGDLIKAEQFYLKALKILDRNGKMENVYGQAVDVYRNYAILLRVQTRIAEADKMDKRAEYIQKYFDSRR